MATQGYEVHPANIGETRLQNIRTRNVHYLEIFTGMSGFTGRKSAFTGIKSAFTGIKSALLVKSRHLLVESRHLLV